MSLDHTYELLILALSEAQRNAPRLILERRRALQRGDIFYGVVADLSDDHENVIGQTDGKGV